MNFVIIVIDTLRYDHIGAHGNGWIQTPNLDRLVGESWDFANSYCASFPTIPHRTDAMTGRSGSPLFPWMPLRWDLATLPWTLAEAGYATQLIHDTPHLVNGGHNFDWPFHAWTQIRGAEVDRPWLDTKDWWPENWERDPLFDFVGREPQELRLIPTYARANRLRVPCPLVPRAIEARLSLSAPGEAVAPVSGAIYRPDGSLVCVAERVWLDDTTGRWVTLPLGPSADLAPGEEYLIAVHCADPLAGIAAADGDCGYSCGDAVPVREPWPRRIDARADGMRYSIALVVDLPPSAPADGG